MEFLRIDKFTCKRSLNEMVFGLEIGKWELPRCLFCFLSLYFQSINHQLINDWQSHEKDAFAHSLLEQQHPQPFCRSFVLFLIKDCDLMTF